jgi:dihydrofolate synthase/folylpolyglutamate synthase
MAFEIFRREKVQWAVFETGLGGRLDATNVVVPAVSVIARIAMDHMDYLGGDVASIAAEKLGIVKRGVPLVMAEPENEGIKDMAVKRCNGIGTSCRFVAGTDAADCRVDPDGASFWWDGRPYHINLQGAYQVCNALLALCALKVAGFNDYGPVARGCENAVVPGRFQVMTVRGRSVVFDVGHNPDAATAFCRSFRDRFGDVPVCLVLGIMKDKDIAGMMAHYAAVARRIICTAPATERAASPENLKKSVPGAFKGSLLTAATVASGVETAMASPEEIVCIAGSFFTVGEAMAYLNIDPYK